MYIARASVVAAVHRGGAVVNQPDSTAVLSRRRPVAHMPRQHNLTCASSAGDLARIVRDLTMQPFACTFVNTYREGETCTFSSDAA